MTDDTMQAFLRRRLSDPNVAVKHRDLQWSWSQYLAKAAARAAALIGAADPQRPMHIGSLLGNSPEMLLQMAAAGLGGYVLCGVNNTRRGEALAADIARRLRYRGPRFLISAATGRGTRELAEALMQFLEQRRAAATTAR